MHVILHAGAHRTASSTLQHHMARHRMRLAQDGVIYWGPRITRGGLFRGAIGGIVSVLPWQRRRFVRRAAIRAEAVRQTGASHLVISDENMLGSLRNTLDKPLLYPDAAARIAAYAKGFERYNLTIALCLRDYADWWTSALAFRLPRGGPMPHPALREHFVTQPRRWRFIVEEIARAVPDANIVVWTYEALADQPGQIVEELTGQRTFASATARRNARPVAAELRRVMAECQIDPADFQWPDGEFMPFEAHEVEALRAQYQDDIAWLSAGAGGLADHIDMPTQEASSGQGRGTQDDGETRRLA